MPWVYNIRTKTFKLNGKYMFSSMYAGAPGFKDDPALQCVKNKGPLPRGSYTISDPIAHHPTAGRFVLRLAPHRGNSMCGRSGFLIHGDNGRGTASNGCIVLDRQHRKDLVDSSDKELIVA